MTAMNEITEFVAAQRWRCRFDPEATRRCVEAAVRTWPVVQEPDGCRLMPRTEDEVRSCIRYGVRGWCEEKRSRPFAEFILRILASIVSYLLIAVLFASPQGEDLILRARGET